MPEEQPPVLGNHDADPDRGGERGAEHRPVLDLDDPVAALALLRFVGALELDEVRSARTLLSELQASAGHLKVCVPSPAASPCGDPGSVPAVTIVGELLSQLADRGCAGVCSRDAHSAVTSARAKPSWPLAPTVWIAVALTRGSAASSS